MSEPSSDPSTDDLPRGPALFARLGEAKLRAVITEFYDRVFRDVMIGFMFEGKNRAQLIEREYEFTARLLGAPQVVYRGQAIRAAHARHTIFGGQFERRLQILKEAMDVHDVPPEVRRVWIDHTLALRDQVTRDRGSECGTPASPGLEVAPTPAANPIIKLGRK